MSETPNQEPEIDFSHYFNVLLRRRWIVAFIALLIISATAIYTLTTRPVFEAASLIVIEKERTGGGLYANSAMVESSNDDYYQTQYKLLRSHTLLQKVYKDLRLDQEPDFASPWGIDDLQASIVIAPVVRSRLVQVKSQSHDPQLAAKIANSLSENFVAQNLSNQLFISKDVLQALQSKQSSANAQQTYDSLPAVVNNSLIQTLKGEYAKLESQAAEMSQRFTPKYPGMIALRSNMAALKGQIQSETDKIVQSLKTELSGQLQGNNVRIIDPALVPVDPIKPRKRRALFLGILAGLCFGFCAALLVEMIDQSIRTQEDVENRLSLPFIGLIPESPQAVDKRVYDALLSKELSLTSEALRNLRTMIDFAAVSNKMEAIIVSSTVQEEGKSFIASNLAVTFAQLGEKVLLIDGDLRRPKLHKNFQASSERGLSDFLARSKSTEEVEELIQTTNVPNLSLLVCGTRPPNPSELLNTPRLGALMSWVRSHYDRVIVDCTPLFPINDTLLWGRHIPFGVFVVRYGRTRVPLIKAACQKLQKVGVRVLGVAVNAAKAGGLTYASYGYYYHQQYYHQYHQEAAENSKKVAAS